MKNIHLLLIAALLVVTKATLASEPSPITIVKTGPEYSKAGDDAIYEVTITNISPSGQPDVIIDSIIDSLQGDLMNPANYDSSTCDGDLAPGESCTITYTYTVQQEDPDPLENSVVVIAHLSGSSLVLEELAFHSVDLLHPDFTVTKECITNPVGVGEEAIFKITVTNTGDVELVINDDEDLWSNVALGIDDSLIEEIGITVEPGDTVIPNEITVTATLPEKYGLDNILERTASDECSVSSEIICGFTQGFYGNTGGKFNEMTTTEIINSVLGSGVVVGNEGVRSITFDSAACIILRLPAGGPPKALPSGLGDVGCDSLPGSLVKKNKPEINNVLIGQVVALTLNVRLSPALGSLELTKGPYTGLTVNELLALANDALADDETPKSALSDINDAVTIINEAFDECAYL